VTTPKFKVVIHVSGGVAEVAECPPEVEVEIIDWDNICADEDALSDKGLSDIKATKGTSL
jgi:hypothetical protein